MTKTRGSIGKQWLTREQAEREIAEVNKAIKEGYPPTSPPSDTTAISAIRVAAERIGQNRKSFTNRVGRPGHPGTWKRLYGIEPNWGAKPEAAQEGSPFSVKHAPQAAWVDGPVVELTSRPDNTFIFGATGDLHAASKYTRWDVREDLYRQYIEQGAQCVFDTGNWIDGEANFNRYDIEAHGLDSQCLVLAKNHPKGIGTYAVWGDDHEGWYVSRDGIDVGRYCESVMQAHGHDWTNLGFMEAHVALKNANTGATTIMTVAHPGGGSAYALSYSIQKIIESLEGGEKPAVGLYGHYHKLWSGLIRNVWVVQTGCGQDQTPFMRKKRLEAHVGGSLVKLRQDPETGAILSMSAELIRYFNRGFYVGTGRWSKHGPVRMLERSQRAIR